MIYEEKKKIIEAAEILKEYCKKNCCNSDNANCLFEKTKGVCSIRKDYPTAWIIPKVTRWTPEDVALAKALKGFGANRICRNTRGDLFCITKDRYDRIGIPAFINLETGENIFIDTIIEEAKE